MATTTSNLIIQIIFQLMRLFLVIAVPVLLVIASVRIVMTTQFLNLEYSRAGFEDDPYGFTTQDRKAYGQYGILYLLNDADIDYLGERVLPGNLCYPPDEAPCSLFNDDELSHMQDVKIVARGTFTVGLWGGILALVFALVVWRYISIEALRLSLMQGSILTLGLIATIILLAITSWDLFFSTFHKFFFEDGTWRFFYSDTLIRLYPEQFWFDASLIIGGLTTVSAVIIFVATYGVHRIRRLLP